MKIYKFRNCQLNTLERSVLKDGKRLDLTPKTFDVLQLLVENAGEVVTKDRILGTVWDGSFVEESNLAVHISRLRRALNESAAEHYIETVVGTGYRFISTVEAGENIVLDTGFTTKSSTYSESHRLYLKGKFFQEKETRVALEKAVEYFQKSISLDPINIQAYAEIVHCYRLLYTRDHISYSEVQSKISPYITSAATLGQDDDNVQTALGRVSITLEWNFSSAEKHFRRAIEINPDNRDAHRSLSMLLVYSKRFPEALGLAKKMLSISPISVINLIDVGRLFYLMGMYDTAVNHLNEALELDPSNHAALSLLGVSHIEMESFNKALAFLEQSYLAQKTFGINSRIGMIFALLGRKDDARKIIKQIEEQTIDGAKHSIKLARIYAALGEKDKALDLLERSFDEHESDLLALRVDPAWKTIRNHDLLKVLTKRIGIP